MTDHFDVYVHTDRVQMPAGNAWVVTIVRERDGRMQQYTSWEHQFPATAAGHAVQQALEFAGARSTLHTIGEHPNYDRAPAVPEPWDFDAVVGGIMREEIDDEQERDTSRS